MKCTTRAKAIERYGQIDLGHRVWPKQSEWMVMLDIPEDLRGGWKVYGSPVKRIYVNNDMKVPLLSALRLVKEKGLQHELKTFDGCFNIRSVRGSASVSAHAYGLAIDLNADENKLGQEKPKLSSEFVECFTRHGFDWGGNFHSRKDPMHFSFCWEGVAVQENAPHLILG